MDTRKVQKTSDGTYFVTLPKAWVTQRGVDRGSLLAFENGKDGKLTLGLYAKEERSFASATLSPSSILRREIEEKYLLGYDLIQIESKEVLHSEVRDKAKAILKRLVGLEIVEEDGAQNSNSMLDRTFNTRASEDNPPPSLNYDGHATGRRRCFHHLRLEACDHSSRKR